MMYCSKMLLPALLIATAVWGCKKADTSAGAAEPEPAEAAIEEVPNEPAQGDAEPASDAPEPAAAEAEPAPPVEPASPPSYTVKLETTKGDILIDVYEDWAPLGAARFRELVEANFYKNVAFFRVIEGFMAQAGISGKPKLNAKWQKKPIKDDPLKRRNTRGTVTFAMAGADSRTTQFFINLADNPQLDPAGFAPFGKVRDMTAVDSLYCKYGEGAPNGIGPMQFSIATRGNRYLKKDFPRLDYIIKATIVEE